MLTGETDTVTVQSAIERQAIESNPRFQPYRPPYLVTAAGARVIGELYGLRMAIPAEDDEA